MNIYLIGSLRNPKVPELGNELRAWGYNVFEDWYAAGPNADDEWRKYEQGRGRSFVEALQGLAVGHVFDFDSKHLLEADIGILMLPAGKSGHLELGVLVGRGKRTYILLDGEPKRWDMMYLFATAVFTDKEELFATLRESSC